MKINKLTVEAPLEERNVNERAVKVHKLKDEDLDRVRVLVLGLRSGIL